jgi:hypothetical protein
MGMSHVAEVIESSTTECVAQSYELDNAPPLGSLVTVSRTDGAITIYGVVAAIQTLPLDPARKPIARGKDATTLQDIHDQHPQLRELFRTEFTFRVLGYQEAEALHHYLPPQPPEIHQLVYTCTGEQVNAFTDVLTFLPLLLSGRDSDEVAGAFLRTAAATRLNPQPFLVQAGKAAVDLLRGDAPRLNALLARLR